MDRKRVRGDPYILAVLSGAIPTIASLDDDGIWSEAALEEKHAGVDS